MPEAPRALLGITALALLLGVPSGAGAQSPPASPVTLELGTPTLPPTPTQSASANASATPSAPPLPTSPTAPLQPIAVGDTPSPSPSPTLTALPSATAPPAVTPAVTVTAMATAVIPPVPGVLVGRELLLSGEDVPPGYQEVYQRLDQLNIDTRVFVRPDLATSTWLIGSVVYVGDEVLPPMTAPDAERFRSEFMRGLLLGMRGLEVRDWEPVAGAGVGEQELAYRFSYDWENDLTPRTGVGAMTPLIRGRVQSILMAMSSDESAIDEVRRYARIADARVEQALRRAP